MESDRPATQIYEFGGFSIDERERLLTRAGGEELPLTPRVFDTLLYLVRNRGRLIEKDELMREVWPDTIVEENNLSQNISTLRRVLREKRGEQRFIATIPGRGYRFVADVTESPDERGSQTFEPAKPISTEFRWKSGKLWIFASGALVVLLLVTGLYISYQGEQTVARPTKTIAVLPFKPLVSDTRDEAFEIGMTDTLIARLSENREIIVRPFGSVRRFGAPEQDPLVAGRELGVESVLEGSIQRWGEKIRVNVRLVSVSDGTALWSGTFDEKSSDIFAVQDSITRRVAEALRLPLGNSDRTQLGRRYTKNPEAYELYAKGRYYTYKLTHADVRKGIEFYQKAIDIDPTYSLAYAGMADAYRSLPINSDGVPKETLPMAKAAATKALELDEELPEAHVVLCWVEFWFNRNWIKAEEEIKRAIELNPNSADARRTYASLLSVMGRHDEALAQSGKAREIDPLSLITNALDAQFLFYAGRNDEAIKRINKALEIDPNFWIAHINLAKVYIQQERYKEALEELESAKKYSGGSHSETISLTGYALAKSGRRGEALATLYELRTASNERYVPPYNLAMVYNGLDDTSAAFESLEKAFDDRDVRMTLIKVDPKWDGLRNDPRFADLIKRMNFE